MTNRSPKSFWQRLCMPLVIGQYYGGGYRDNQATLCSVMPWQLSTGTFSGEPRPSEVRTYVNLRPSSAKPRIGDIYLAVCSPLRPRDEPQFKQCLLPLFRLVPREKSRYPINIPSNEPGL